MAKKDPVKQRAAFKKHYEKNKAAYMARAKVWDKATKLKVLAWVLDYLLQHPCLDCGERDPIVLEFDHREGSEKSFNVSEGCTGRFSLARVIDEVAKCDVRCTNCHRRRTYFRAGYKHRGELLS